MPKVYRLASGVEIITPPLAISCIQSTVDLLNFLERHLTRIPEMLERPMITSIT